MSRIVFSVFTGMAFCLPGPSCGAGEAIDAYAETVSATPGLVAWWRFEGDVADQQGLAPGRAARPETAFVDGPGGGRALNLADGQYVTMGDTPALDLTESTVELWFQGRFSKPPYNPCLIAKRADGSNRLTRFSIHVWQDYSCLAVWNGRSVLRFSVGEPLRAGQWYHGAVVFTEAETQLYVNGVACDREGGGTLDRSQRGLPLSIGSSQPKGVELFDGAVDEVAVYRRALGPDEIASHTDAMGFRPQRLRLAAAGAERIRQQEAREAETAARREARRAALLEDPTLMARGETRVYQKDHLNALSFPVGGIGSGTIQMDGRAVRHVWQIFNNHRHVFVPHSFFAVRVQAGGHDPAVRALQAEPVGPFAAMADLAFRGEYPFGWYAFRDPALPVEIRLEAFNPLVPLELENSAIPCAVFQLSATNRSEGPVDVAFLATQQNAVGLTPERPVDGRRHPGYGGNRNEIFRDSGLTLLHMSSTRPPGPSGSDDMALMARADEVTATASWTSLEALARQFAASGLVPGPESAGPSPAGETIDGGLQVRFSLKPGQARQVAFVLVWYFPNASHGARDWGGSGNRYAQLWPSAFVLARELAENLDELTRKTRLYHDTLYQSNLPHWLLDRISSPVAVLRSRTCFWTQEGYFGGWEGCCPETGCCHGNCNHVWHYAQAHARLFPSLARRMRQQEFHFQGDDGAIPHRQPRSHAAFDGQCGTVLNAYREHLMSPDRQWLDQNWPSIQRAMEYLIARWDPDRDGVLTGPQWNTLDGALGGSSSWLGSLYLAALAAAERMARLEGDPEAAERYAAIRRSGSQKQDQTLFNGEYYFQIPDPEPHEDYATGCHIDQVLGQWWAHQLDLGWLYPPDHVRTALASLFRYNFRGRMEGLRQVPRQFVADDDAGMQMITWPKGPRPAKVIRYADEVMTGFEYSAAAAMIQAGLLREGLVVLRAVSDRYDGRLREGLTPSRTASWGYSGNPFGDDECGKFYARAMSVWSVLLACQGFSYDGPAGSIGFRPVWKPEDHASFFTAAEGWGLFRQRRQDTRQTDRIEVRYGRLRLRQLLFELPPATRAGQVELRRDARPLDCTTESSGGQIRIRLAQPVVVTAPQALEATITTTPVRGQDD